MDWRTWKKMTGRDHLNDSIIKIDPDTGKSPGDLRRLAAIHKL